MTLTILQEALERRLLEEEQMREEVASRLEEKNDGAGRSQVNSTTSRWSLGGCPLESLGNLGQQIGHELMTLIEDLL